MYLQFDYQMQIRYSMPVERCYYTIKCIPKETGRQKLLEKKIQMEPQSQWMEGTDGWKNQKIYGCIQSPHNLFSFKISGKVEIDPERYEKPDIMGMYRYPWGKCIPGDGIWQYSRTLDLGGCKNELEKCIRIMNRLHQDYSYVPEQTETHTTAEEAWNLGMGVCQDYAHIYETLLRLQGIPARYVCGLMLGEGASHAWVEALCEGKWIGLDPTNDCLVCDSYIKLGDGRDATECAINRGILINGGNQSQQVKVVVSRI